MTITLTLNANRTTIMAGEAVHFDAVGTTDTHTSLPFHDVFYDWDYDDAGNLDNTAVGPVAAHTFRDSGTYTVTLRGRNRYGDDVTATQVITVNAWSAANVISISTTTDFTGATVGSTHKTETTLAGALAWAAPGKILEFHAGQTWSSSSYVTVSLTLASATCGVRKFGTGADPIWDYTGTSPFTGLFLLAQSDGFCLRDIKFTDSGAATGDINAIQVSDNVTNTTFVDFAVDGYPISLQGYSAAASGKREGFAIHRMTVTGIIGAQIVIGMACDHCSFVGCDIGDGDQHLLRFYGGNYLECFGNTFGSVASSQHQVKAHTFHPSSAANDSQYWNFHKNTYKAALCAWKCAIGPQNSSYDERVSDVICDSDYMDISTSYGVGHAIFGVTNVTIRNPIHDFKSNPDGGDGAFIGQRGVEPAPTGFRMYHQTCYGSGAAGTLNGLSIGTYGTGTPVQKNAIVYAPSMSATIANSTITGGGSQTTDPSFVDATNQDFSLGASSTALDAGVLVDVINSFNGAMRIVGGGDTADAGAYEEVTVPSGPSASLSAILPAIQSSIPGDVTSSVVSSLSVSLLAIRSSLSAIKGTPGMGLAITAGYDANYQTYQRDIFSKKSFHPIEISLDLSGSSAVAGVKIQGKIIEVSGGSDVTPWVDLGSVDPDSLALKVVEFRDVPQGGWYNWRFRTVDAFGNVIDTASPANKWGVGDVYIYTGQSNGEDMFTEVGVPTVNAKTAVFTSLTTWGLPTTQGIAAFLDHMHEATLAAGEDIPIAGINACLGGSATLAEADYVAVGHWEENGPRPIFTLYQIACVRALRHHRWVLDSTNRQQVACRCVIYWQGEAEASETVVTFKFIEQAQFITGLLEVFKNFQKWMPTQTDVNTLQIQIGRLEQNSATEVPDGMNTAVAMTRETHYALANDFPEAQAALCGTMGLAKGTDGVHHTPAQLESAGDLFAYACRKALGIYPDTALGGSRTALPSTSGPIIVGAKWTSTTNLRITVQHESGSDITVPTTAHECFQLVNATGKAGFSASTRVSATEFDLTLNSSSTMQGGKYCLAYCNDAMPNQDSLITDDEGFYLHPTFSNQGDRETVMPALAENILAGDDSICSGVGSANTVVVAVGDGAKIKVGDTVYVSDRIGIASRGYRRVLSVSGDTVTVSRNFLSTPQTLDVCRYSNTTNPPFLNGRHANGGIVVDSPSGGITGIRGKRLLV